MTKPLHKKSAALLLTLLATITGHAEPVIHRAVEPAQILLDITLKESSLTLYLTIPAPALPLLLNNKEHKDIARLLTDTPDLWLTAPEAQCTLNSQRVFHNKHENAGQPPGDIQGFYDFNCLTPQSLFSISPNLHSTLPGLKQLNIWLTTDNWQNKQSLMMPNDGVITIQPGS